MRRLALFLCGIFMLAVGVAGSPLFAMTAAPAVHGVAQVTVTVQPRNGTTAPTVTANTVFVYQDHARCPIVSWTPARGKKAGLDFAILIDDSLSSSIANQFPALVDFIQSLPPTTRVEIAYAANGTAIPSQGFTGNHPLAAKALRLPLGPIAVGGDIYESVSSLLKHWPEDGNRRAVLLISDGIDLNRGVVESEPTLNIDLQQAIEQAQRHDVPIFTIYANSSNTGYSSNLYLLNNGQGCLLRLAYDTGGQAYLQGSQTPVNLTPYLDKLSEALGNQYLLTFHPKRNAQADYQRLRVIADVPGVKLLAPRRVYVPAAG
jgi:VWFA-related protein